MRTSPPRNHFQQGPARDRDRTPYSSSFSIPTKILRLVPPIPEGFQPIRGREAHPGFTRKTETTPEGLKHPQVPHQGRVQRLQALHEGHQRHETDPPDLHPICGPRPGGPTDDSPARQRWVPSHLAQPAPGGATEPLSPHERRIRLHRSPTPRNTNRTRRVHPAETSRGGAETLRARAFQSPSSSHPAAPIPPIPCLPQRRSASA
jgi:hypothetical protein